MDFDVSKFPLHHHFDYAPKDGDEWTVVDRFRESVKEAVRGYSALLLVERESLALVATPEAFINIARDCERSQGSIAPLTQRYNPTVFQRYWKPITYINSRKEIREPTILVLKSEAPPEILLVMKVDDFQKSLRLFANAMSLNFHSGIINNES